MALILSNATGGGLYSATTSWAGGVLPVVGDSVDIVAGDTIEVDGTYGAGDDTATAFVINGILKASRTASSELSFRGEVTIGNTGELDYGKSADPIPVGIIAKLRLNDSATLLAGEWGLTCNQTGKYFVYGASKTTNTDLTTQLLAAGTTFTVTDATGWAVGDTVVIATTSPGSTGGQTEEATISAIAGNNITISAGVTNLHEIGARVGNFTKNVKIEAFNSAYVSYQNLKTDSSSLADTREIQHVELRYMGDNSTSVKYGGFRFDAGGQAAAAAQYTSIGNITGYATDQYLLDFYNFYPNRVTVNDCAHYNSNGGASAFYTRQGSAVTFNNCVVYRSGTGLLSSWSQGGVNVIVNDCWFVGCTTGFNNSSGQGFTFNNTTFASCNTGINFGWGAAPTFNNCNIGYSNGLYNGACLYGWAAQTNANIIPSFYDCNFNVTNEYSTLTIASGGFKLFVSNKNVDPSQQEIYTPYGIFYRDNVTFRSGVASIRCEPLNATNPASNEWQIFAPTGQPVVVSGYLRKDALYGATNLPKVTLSGLGITESTYTMTDVNDTWEQFHVSATQTTGTDGILTLKVEFQGATGGKAWIDGIIAPPTKAVNSGDIGYWAGGQPAKLIASNFTSPDDIWNKLIADITLTGSIGKQLKDNVDEAVSSRAPSGEYDVQLDATISSRAPLGEYDIEMARVDTTISSRSSHTPADVWAVTTRTLSSFGTLIADIWANVARTLTAGTKDTEIDAIKAKTDNLPADPASETNVNANETKIDALQTDITTIKKIEANRWKITGNQFIIYDDDKVTPLFTFDLKNDGGLPTEDAPKERTPI